MIDSGWHEARSADRRECAGVSVARGRCTEIYEHGKKYSPVFPLRAEGALSFGISLSIRDEICDSGLDAPIGAMRRKARKEQGAWQMQGKSLTRPEVSALVYGDGRTVQLIIN